MKKYMLSFMLISASCALPIMAMESANQQTKNKDTDKERSLLAFNKFKVAYPELHEFYTVITSKKADREQKIAVYKKYFDTLIKVAIEDRNYFTNTSKNNQNVPFTYLKEAMNDTKQERLQEIIIAIENSKQFDENLLNTVKKCPTLFNKSNEWESEMKSQINKQNAQITMLKELLQKGNSAIETIEDMQKKGNYTPNPEYHAQKTPLKPAHGLSLATYACIAGGIALGAAAIVGISYWIKKQLVDKKKQNTLPTKKPHLAS